MLFDDDDFTDCVVLPECRTDQDILRESAQKLKAARDRRALQGRWDPGLIDGFHLALVFAYEEDEGVRIRYPWIFQRYPRPVPAEYRAAFSRAGKTYAKWLYHLADFLDPDVSDEVRKRAGEYLPAFLRHSFGVAP